MSARVIHKVCPTWGVTQCGIALFSAAVAARWAKTKRKPKRAARLLNEKS